MDGLILHGGGDRPESVEGQIWIPHVCVDQDFQAALVWELSPQSNVEEKMGAAVEDVERWARQPRILLALASLAASRGEFVEAASRRPHLSLRWILANQEVAAEAATGGHVEIDHVSRHVVASEEEAVVRLLVDVLGLAEIPRPPQITVPGRWLQAGRSRIHLNSRSGDAGEADFPGPRPNHLCFGVDDLDVAEANLEAAGVSTTRSGSLGRQLWFRLAETSIELQPLPDRKFPSE
jgi:hypothetical protein